MILKVNFVQNVGINFNLKTDAYLGITDRYELDLLT